MITHPKNKKKSSTNFFIALSITLKLRNVL